jgi:hypothetical protein
MCPGCIIQIEVSDSRRVFFPVEKPGNTCGIPTREYGTAHLTKQIITIVYMPHHPPALLEMHHLAHLPMVAFRTTIQTMRMSPMELFPQSRNLRRRHLYLHLLS